MGKLKKKIKKKLMDALGQVMISRRRYGEVRKFWDKRRVKIWRSVKLSKDQKKQIDTLYKDNYGKRISRIWHRHYMAYTGCFDPGYFPEMLYIPEFEHFMNQDSAYTRSLGDKNVLPYLAYVGG